MVKHCCGTAIRNVIKKHLQKRSYVNLIFNSSLKCNMHCCVKKILSLPINLDENTCLPVILLLVAAVLVSMHLVTRHVGIQMEGIVHYAQLFQISSKNCKWGSPTYTKIMLKRFPLPQIFAYVRASGGKQRYVNPSLQSH